MRAAIADLPAEVRYALADWVGERPETVIAVAALLSCDGRVWIDGDPKAPSAALIESALIPGEPQGFGDGEALLRLLADADGWACVEVEPALADEIGGDFASRWGLARTVTDVIHELNDPVTPYDHPLVRGLTPAEINDLPTVAADLMPDRRLASQASAHGRFFAAVEDGVIVGQGGSFAWGRAAADVGVHVAAPHRGQGLASACASSVCVVLQRVGLTPVWGTSSENAASLAVAQKLGFVEVSRLTFLVSGHG